MNDESRTMKKPQLIKFKLIFGVESTSGFMFGRLAAAS